MLCVKCQKRPAVVFVQRLENGKTVQEGYCLTCARAMHIQPVDDLMKQFGMSDQDLENMEERMSSFLQEASDSGMLAPMMNGDDTDAGDEPAPQDDFVPGGSPVFPFGFGARQNKDDAKPKNGKKEKAPRRKFLETYCENLTQKARDGKTDRIIGRDREIYRTIQILCRRQKNNPCLIGEAGVGKTAIAEGIAQRIAEGKVPARLQDKEIYLLDMTSLVAGTQFRGQFEQRVKGLISEVKAAGNIILFIDEIHSIVGAGDSDGSMNAANIMKPALVRAGIGDVIEQIGAEVRFLLHLVAGLRGQLGVFRVAAEIAAHHAALRVICDQHQNSVHRMLIAVGAQSVLIAVFPVAGAVRRDRRPLAPEQPAAAAAEHTGAQSQGSQGGSSLADVAFSHDEFLSFLFV